MATLLFPRQGDRLRASSIYFQAVRVAASGIAVVSGMVPSRASSSSIAVSSGSYRNVNLFGSYAGGSITSIPAASANNHRYDAIVFDVADSTLKRIAGTEAVPSVATDFLENITPQPPEILASQILLCIFIVNSAGVVNESYGHYASNGIANMIIELPSPKLDDLMTPDDNTDLNASTLRHGLIRKLNGESSCAFLGNGEWGFPYPTFHSGSHVRGAYDTIKLDDLSEPDDNTDLNVSIVKHGLCPKAPNDVGYWLRGDAQWAVLPTIKLDDAAAPDDNTDLNASIYKHGLMPKLPNTAQTLRGDGAWVTRGFDIAFPFGDGVSVISDGRCEFRVPVAAKINEARIIEQSNIVGNITCQLYKRNAQTGWGNWALLSTFVITSDKFYWGPNLNIQVAADDWLSIRVSGASAMKQIVCSLTLEAT